MTGLVCAQFNRREDQESEPTCRDTCIVASTEQISTRTHVRETGRFVSHRVATYAQVPGNESHGRCLLSTPCCDIGRQLVRQCVGSLSKSRSDLSWGPQPILEELSGLTHSHLPNSYVPVWNFFCWNFCLVLSLWSLLTYTPLR